MVDIRTLRKAIAPPARMGMGLWVMPQEYLGQERDLAVRLDAAAVDARTIYLDSVPPGSRFSGLTEPGQGAQRLYEALYRVSQMRQAHICLLVHTLDLLLFGLRNDARGDECAQFWKQVLAIPYPTTRLVLTIPAGAYSRLVPPSVQASFADRIAEGGL